MRKLTERKDVKVRQAAADLIGRLISDQFNAWDATWPEMQAPSWQVHARVHPSSKKSFESIIPNPKADHAEHRSRTGKLDWFGIHLVADASVEPGQAILVAIPDPL